MHTIERATGPRPSTNSVMSQLPLWIAHFNEVIQTRLSVIVHPVNSLQLKKDPRPGPVIWAYNN